MIAELDRYRKEIQLLCATHKVKNLYAFGSVVAGKLRSNSDIDLLVDFDKMDVAEYADNYFDLKFSLQEMLKRPIDLLEESALKNPYFRESISKSRQLIYAH